MTSNLKLQVGLVLLSLIASCLPVIALAQDSTGFPRFRQPMTATDASSAPPAGVVKLLAEPDYAPWSFALEDGTLAGISVDLALLACEDAGLNCEVTATPYTALVSGLVDKKGDAIVSGLRVTAEIASTLAMTRPYFKSLGQFAARSGTPVQGIDPGNLAGRRIGHVENSLHGAFLSTYYGKSTLLPMENEARLFEELRTGALDVVFADAVRLMFWMNGETSRNCCVKLGRAIVDPETITRPLVFMMRPDGQALRDRFDAALDRLEQSGRTAEVFKRYLPAAIW